MSDLISRSELLEELKSLKIVLDGKQIFSDDAKDTVLRIVNEQPIAYDINKVVEELGIERKTANNTYNSLNMDVDLGRELGLEKAIEIVNHVGASDDVCEWKRDDTFRGMQAYKAGCCGKILDLTVRDALKMNKCPYCGKKIKVVE